MMELITSPCSWSWVRCWRQLCDALYVAGTSFTATESAAILSTAREMKVRNMTTSNNSPPPGPKCWNCPCGCPRGSNKSNWTVHQWHFRKSEAYFPWLVQTVCLLLAVVFGSYWNFRPWRNSQPQELVMGLCPEESGKQYNVCVIIENCWRK